MAAKDTEVEAVEKPKHEPKEASAAVNPQPQTAQPVVVQVEKPKNSQTVLTIAIVSGVVLFFLGLGLGYLLGRSTTSRTNAPLNSNQLPGERGGRRFSPNSGTNNNSGTTNPNTKTN